VGKFFEALKKSDGGKIESPPEASKDSEILDRDRTMSAVADDRPITKVRQLAEKPTPPEVESVAPSSTIEPPKADARVPRPAHLHYSINKNLVAYHSPHSFEAEQFRMLRTNILFPPNSKPSPRTILVTSALPGEGKSFVSSNLALSIAQNIDKHVLLIDCDMRRPTVHKLFGFGNVPGLSNYLTGECALSDLLLKIGNSPLSILPGGPIPPNPAELLSSNRMLALLREVRARYNDRYIIVDSPPPHLTAESKALGQFVDGILFVVRFDKTRRDLVSQLVDKFQKGKILGVVANGLRRDSTAFIGSGKYAKHGYYGSKE